MPSERPIGFGVLGCADIAVRRVLPTLRSLPELNLVAVASRDSAKAGTVAARFGCEPVAGYERLLDDPRIDAVYVPLPSGLHAGWVEAALRAGKHVLSEKPMTTGYEDTRRLVALARSAGLVLHENFMFVHHSCHEYVRKLLDDGAIGELRTLTSTFTMPPRPPSDIRYRRDLGGGALLDNGAYPVRVAQMFLGPELEVVGAGLRRDQDKGVDVGGSALLRRADGVTAHLTFGMEHYYVSSYELLGATGRISVERAFTPPPTYQPVVRVERQDHREEITLPPDDQCLNTLAEFAKSIRLGEGVGVHADTMLRQAALIDEIQGQAGG